MWSMITERIPSLLGVFCTVLAYLIPLSIYKVNQKLHEDADPPWKKEEEKQSSPN
ncbi:MULTISPECIES: hypothetical protein [Oceanobacillus]|uniref:Uncharacterized protein n=1 Tax=Oceanobacillus indicireducens TaxID=1004261 RepID=A0A917XVN2_9BACI|nr:MULTISPECIES: hypothetical protein [Oceanobacillus]GGN54432.1 hypothetical protein GCM10007971_12150 [Oceanobacillus indicireducens]